MSGDRDFGTFNKTVVWFLCHIDHADSDSPISLMHHPARDKW